MVRGVGLVVVLSLALGIGVAGASLDFYRAGPNAVGLFSNLTGDTVDELVLRFSGSVEPVNAIGVGAEMQLESNVDGELHFTGAVVPSGTWEVDWTWDGPRLEYAAWLRDGVIVEEIPVHNPTAAFGMIGQYAGQRIRFFAPASGDPDGLPLVQYRWLWSDGVAAAGVQVARTFTAGNYWVILTVRDADGNETSRLGKFEIKGCTLTVNVEGCGTVNGETSLVIACEYGSEIVLDPAACDHWDFVSWEDDLSGSDDPVAIRVLGDTTITAIFSQHLYVVSAHAEGSGQICAQGNAGGQPLYECGNEFTFTAFFGDDLTFTAIPEAHWDFADWSGDYGTENPIVITIPGDMSIIANFEELVYRIVFQDAGVSGNWDVYTTNEDGTGLLNLTQNSAEDKYPRWSPNGEWIGFSSTRDGKPWRPYIVSSDGGSARLLVDMAAIDLVWGTDDLLAFVNAGDNGFGDIWTIHADGTGLAKVSSGVLFYGVTMAPSGTRISGIAPYASGTTLYAMNADGTGLRHYGPPASQGTCYGAIWSPDSRYIAYCSDTALEIYDFDTDTSRVVITAAALGAPYCLISSHPEWDAAGERLVFEAGSPTGYYDVWTVNIDGTNPKRITAEPLRETSTGWSPDSDELLIVHQSSPAGFRVVDAETSAVHYQYPMAASSSWYHTYPMWEGQSQ